MAPSVSTCATLFVDAWAPLEIYSKFMEHVSERSEHGLDGFGGGHRFLFGSSVIKMREQLEAQCEEGKELVLIMHGMGAVKAGEAAKGLSTTERRAQKKRGGVIGLIAIAGVLAAEGQSVVTAIGEGFGRFARYLEDEYANAYIAQELRKNFFPDINEKLANHYDDKDNFLFVANDAQQFITPTSKPAWMNDAYQGKLAYIVLKDDAVIMQKKQDELRVATGKEWERTAFRGSHFGAFVNEPQGLSDAVKEYIAEFVKQEIEKLKAGTEQTEVEIERIKQFDREAEIVRMAHD